MHALPTPTPTSHIGGKVSHALIHLHQPHIGWKGSHGTVTLTHICYIGLEGSILSHIHHLYTVYSNSKFEVGTLPQPHHAHI